MLFCDTIFHIWAPLHRLAKLDAPGSAPSGNLTVQICLKSEKSSSLSLYPVLGWQAVPSRVLAISPGAVPNGTCQRRTRCCAGDDQQFAKIFQFRPDFRSRTCRAARGPADVRHAQLAVRTCLILTNQGTGYFPRCCAERHLLTADAKLRLPPATIFHIWLILR